MQLDLAKEIEAGTLGKQFTIAQPSIRSDVAPGVFIERVHQQ